MNQGSELSDNPGAMRPGTEVQLHLGVAGRVASAQSGSLEAATTITLGGLTLTVAPAAATLTATNTGGALHYWRWADGTLKPLPADPPPLTLARGDAYIAVAVGDPPTTDSVTIARFLHLRDYFNAQRLAEALLAHLTPLPTSGSRTTNLAILVIEAR